MKSLNTYLKDNKSSLISLNEKLLVNKNFKDTNANDEFYNEFGGILSANSDIGWFKTYNIKNSIPMKIAIEDKNAVNKIKEFFNISSIKYSRSVTDDYKKERALYYDILKFISDNKDDMEFFYINEQTQNGDYLIYLFETGKIKVAVWGHEKIVDTNRGTIAFQYIK